MYHHTYGRRQPSGLWAGVWTAVGWVAFTLPLALYAVYVLG